ncbi:hypothetical protein [Actinoallomurus sp. NPDC050550]|uniref:hypothetical protein n=1 Tax=Actinoallomurus sp. NPDC050550 TaxID=3154937 RepID=UPI0033F2EFBD
MAGQDGLRASAARDKDFVGIDTAAMAQLIQQMTSASNAITAWLRTNAALPPSVPRTGLRQAAAVESWVRAQPGMLGRRRAYADAHLSKGAANMPRVGVGRLGGRPGRTTPAGAGHTVGHFPDAHAATRAGAADAAAIHGALSAHRPIPADVWKRLSANADDPDYVKGLYSRLGPAGNADLIAAALGHEARLAAVRGSLGLVSHHLRMDEKWLRELLDEASRKGVHDDVVHVLEHAGLDRRAKVALGHIGLTHLAAAPPGHRIPTPRPPHEAMVRPAATDPEAAAELYARHSGTVHRALAACPSSAALQHLAGHATAGHASAAHPADAHHAATDAQKEDA